MLKDIAAYTDQDRFDALAYSIWALDLERGAYLIKSNGRAWGGQLRFTLIVRRAKAGAARLREMGFGSDWDYRSYIRAWSLGEAIEIGNQRIEKYLAKKGQVTA